MLDFFMCKGCNASGYSYEVASKWHARCKECDKKAHKKRINLASEDQILRFKETHEAIQEVNELEFYKRDEFDVFEGVAFEINTTNDGVFIV